MRTKVQTWFDSVTDRDRWAMLLYLWCVAVLFFCFPFAIPRFIEACRDFGLEFARFGADFINTLFGTELAVPDSGLLEKSEYVGLTSNVSFDWAEWHAFWSAFGDVGNLEDWFRSLAPKVRLGAYISILVVPMVIIGFVLIKRQFYSYHGQMTRSRPLRALDWMSVHIYDLAKEVLIDFVRFLRQNRWYCRAAVLVLLLAFNVYSVLLEAFAWYFHILTTFSLSRFYMAFYKLLVDVVPSLRFLPKLFYIIVGAYIFNRIRRKRGYNVLEHHEAMNKGFIASLPLVNFVWGTMGSKKTTLLTDMALSYSAYFRFKAYEMLLECDLLFPEFPWLAFERSIRYGMSLPRGAEGRVYNLLSARRFVAAMKEDYLHGDFDLWGYNGKTESPDGLVVNDLFDVLSDYAQLYLIYVVSSTLLISNYGIREDADFLDLGNFPRWRFDFFHKDPRLSAACSRHSHVVDFDMFRLGKKLVEDNKDSNGFEFGVVCLTEIGKERGNQIENKKYKIDDVYANPHNDNFNYMLKLIRHFGTVRYFPFVVFLVDDQRPESWSADARELSQLIRVDDCSDKRCAEPLRFVDDYLHDFLFGRFAMRYRKYRFYRADSTFVMASYKRFSAWCHRKFVLAHNTFDFYKADLVLEQGTREGGEEHHLYYLSTKKIYSNRFATDAFAGYAAVRVSSSEVGLDDLPTYVTTSATIEEMQSSNSYMIQSFTAQLLRAYQKQGVR